MSSNKNMLHTLPALDKLFEAIPADQIKRLASNQVNDLINISDAENIPEFINDLKVVSHCHVIGMLPLKLPVNRKSGCSTPIYSITKDSALAMALAVQHLNTGNSSIVNTLGELRKSMCSNTVFTIEYVDTRDDPGVVIEEVFNVTGRKVEDYGYKMPCSFVGAGRAAVTLPSALLTGHKGYVEVSGTSTASQLDYADQYPNFARTIPPEYDNVVPIIAYFTNILELKYLAVIYMNEPYGNSFAEAMAQETENKLGAPNVRRISIDSTGDTIKSALNELKASQYRYVFAVMPTTQFYNELLFTAFDMGLAGKETDYQWFFSDSFSDRSIDLSNNTLRMAYTGTGMIRPSAGRLHNNTKFNDFASQLRNLSASREDTEYIYRIISTCPENSYNNFTDGDIFTSNSNGTRNSPSDTSAFMYDATIAVGMSACYAIGLGNGQGFTGDAQFNNLTQQTRFDGATGDVEFDNSTGSRTYNSTFYALTNYMTEEWLDEETGTYRTDYKKTITNSYYRGEWVNGEETFIFSNGMTKPNQPDQLTPRNPERNLTPTTMKVIALFFSAFSMLLAIGFGLWTLRHRSTRVVKASQPFFLFLILFGVIMVASSIIPYSMDDSTLSESACDKACTAIFWLLFPGLSIIFSALFTKTYRINLIMKNSRKFRRVTVTIPQTLLTMGIMLSLNVITLSIMTAIDPPTFERNDLINNDQFGRPESTYGQCVWENQIPYIVTLFVLNFLIASLSAYQSWKARKLSTEFAESEYIFTTLIITLTLFMVAVPIIIMSRSNPKTSVFTYSAAVFIFCMNILILIFVPKIRFHSAKKESEIFIGGLNREVSGKASDKSGTGEIILTTTSARILAKQVAELQKLLQEKEQQESDYKCNCCKDANTQSIVSS